MVLTTLVATSALLLFLGGLQAVAFPKRIKGWGLLTAGSIGLAVCAGIEISSHRVNQMLAPPEGFFSIRAGMPWTNLREVLPELPAQERAEKTRILAANHYMSTGKLLEHIAPSASTQIFSPTQAEIAEREKYVAWQATSECRLAHSSAHPYHLLLVPLVAAVAVALFRKVASNGVA